MRKTTARKLMIMAGLVTADPISQIGKKAAANAKRNGLDVTLDVTKGDKSIMVFGGEDAQAVKAFKQSISGLNKVNSRGDDAALQDLIVDEIYESSGREMDAIVLQHYAGKESTHMMLLSIDQDGDTFQAFAVVTVPDLED